MEKNSKLLKKLMLAMIVAMGIVISPILRIEGMCPMAHFINILCSVILGPWYSLLCATLIGVIRMFFMGIPPLALTGAVFGAFLSGVSYRVSKGKLICAIVGEVIGTGVIGAILSYPIMTFIWGRTGLTWMFYVPSFIMATLIGGTIAFIFLGALSRIGNLTKIQRSLGAKVYDKPRVNNKQIIANKTEC
ncbi:energy coupling factor transporter S component ThiW [Clostridium botulinum]|nr:energy coupling factor transporter S component ThiW [Clostridium botulinum]